MIGAAPRRTPHSAENQAFTDAAHKHALSVLYPPLFGVEKDAIEANDCTIEGATNREESARASMLDGEMGIDKILQVSYDAFSKPLAHSIQERFRRPEFAANRDLTLTEWNPKSNRPSELHKLLAQWFVYGYFDSSRPMFTEVIACPVPTMVSALAHKQIPFKRQTNPRTGQPFICIPFDELLSAGLVDLHICGDRVLYSTLSDAFEPEKPEIINLFASPENLPQVIYHPNPAEFWRKWGTR